MNREKKRVFAGAELMAGIVLLVIVSVTSVHFDVKTTQTRLMDQINYIKQQCNNELRLDIASETKSLMRIIESAELYATNETMEAYVTNSYLSGIVFLDVNGNVEKEYHRDDLQIADLLEKIDISDLIDVATFKEKTYSTRLLLKDDSYVDVAAVAQKENAGVTLAYYHTPSRYTSIFNHSTKTLLSGYSLEHNGTIAISEDSKIIASNDAKLVGKELDQISFLKTIRKEEKLIRCNHGYGMKTQGRNYCVYAFMPDPMVFSTSLRNICITILIYGSILVAGYVIRWRMVQKYQVNQLEIQKKYAKDLEKKNQDLERANATKSDFLARMSHDMRTPLNGIIGLLKIDEAHFDDKELLEENHKKMMVSAKHLLSLMSDVLQMGKLNEDQFELSNEPVDLYEISNEVGAIMQEVASAEGIHMIFGKQELKVRYVYASPLHLKQIFLNVYSNCIKYNKKQGTVKTSLVYLKQEGNTVFYQWTIQDTGLGMSEEFVSHIFEPFVQEKNDARTIYNGTGLGMAIVKNIVDKMHGQIQVSSKEGIGSTFVITLPFEMADAALFEEKEEKIENDDLTGMHILVVEDNELNAQIAQMLLEDKNAIVDVVQNGKEAIEKIKRNSYEVVLMDVMMPVMNGLEATKEIRTFDKDILIIAMTANAFEEDIKRCLDAGMNAHISKPFDVDKLMNLITHELKRSS